MSDLYNRIESLCVQRGKTVTDMCRESGAPRGSLSDLKYGRTMELSTKTLSKLSAYFGTSIDEIVGENGQEKKTADPKIDGLTQTEYDLLTPAHKAAVDLLIQQLYNAQSNE